jgi:maltose O-acetyltransferase
MKRIFFLILYYGVAYYLPDSYTPIVGRAANWLRKCCCHALFKRCGKIVTVGRHVYFGNGANIEIGDDSGFGPYSRIPNNIIIGNHVMMAPEILIIKNNHKYDNPITPIGQQGPAPAAPVIIEDNVWIGQRAIITPGRRIATGTVVAAGAVVTKDFRPDFIIGGNPAKEIKPRHDAITH